MGAVVAPQTFLQLANSLLIESGTSGVAQGTVVNATGEWLRLCDWIADSYVELQMDRDDWLWMEKDVVFDTIIGQQSYPFATTIFSTPATTGLADFRRWKLSDSSGQSSFRLYLKSAGVNNETYLDASMNYNQFRDYYIFGAKRNTPARPIAITPAPDKSLLLGLPPNDIYTVNGKYYSAPIMMSLDADIPAIPAMYHPLIMYMALEKYALYESAPEVLATAKKFQNLYRVALENEQLEEIQMPDPLV
jgi:hypothetical protein